jgi:DNA-directed RNA polymerase specialized sigma subunit
MAYIDNKKYTEAIIESQKAGKVTDELVKYFQIHIKHLNMRNRNNNPEEAKDYEQYAMLELLKMYKKFDAEKGNAFSFFTNQIVFSLNAAYNQYHKKGVEFISTSYIDEDGNIKDNFSI